MIISFCVECGIRVSPDDIESGAAIESELDGHYRCPDCARLRQGAKHPSRATGGNLTPIRATLENSPNRRKSSLPQRAIILVAATSIFLITSTVLMVTRRREKPDSQPVAASQEKAALPVAATRTSQTSASVPPVPASSAFAPGLAENDELAQIRNGHARRRLDEVRMLLNKTAYDDGLAREALENLIATHRGSPVAEDAQAMLGDVMQKITARLSHLRPISLRSSATACSAKRMFYGKSDSESILLPTWGTVSVHGILFDVVDPANDTLNMILLHSSSGSVSSTMPQEASLSINSKARSIHLLGMVSGWGYPTTQTCGISMVVVIEYRDGVLESKPLVNGVHLADYIRRCDVAGSRFAMDAHGKQMRYIELLVDRPDAEIARLHFKKGGDSTAPMVFGVTVETGE